MLDRMVGLGWDRGWAWSIVGLLGCGPVVGFAEDTSANDPCVVTQPSFVVTTVTTKGEPAGADVTYVVGGEGPPQPARFDGQLYAIWGVSGEHTLIMASDGNCKFEEERIAAEACSGEPPLLVEFVFDRFCGAPPETTSAGDGAPEPEPETSSGGWGGGSSESSSSNSSSDEGSGTTESADATSTDTGSTTEPTGTGSSSSSTG